MSTLCFYAQFTASKIGVNSLTVTWDIEQVTRADGTRTALVTGAANSITIGRRGLYGYVLTNADLTLYDYIATAITATTTVDQQEVPALWTLWSTSWHDIATSIMTIVGSIGKRLSDIPSTAQIDTQLSGTHGSGAWGPGTLGAGAISTTVTVTVSGLARDGIEVWLTTDSAGVNVVASGTTDAMSHVTFMLDAGTYYVWKQLSGVNFTNPETLVVS